MFKICFVVLTALMALAIAVPNPGPSPVAKPVPVPGPKPLIYSYPYGSVVAPSVYSAYVPSLGYPGLYV